MLKKLILPILALMVFVPQIAFAHSTLEQATPAKGATVTEDVTAITLTFNTKVEKGSSVKLKKKGQAISVTSVEINNDKLTAKLEQALKSGDYNVSWEIIGADGHPVNGEYSFTVKNDTDSKTDQDAGTTEQNDSNQENSGNTKNDEQAEDVTDNKTADTTTESDSTQEGMSNGLIAVIAILIVIALVSFGLMIKRGKQ